LGSELKHAIIPYADEIVVVKIEEINHNTLDLEGIVYSKGEDVHGSIRIGQTIAFSGDIDDVEIRSGTIHMVISESSVYI